MFLIDRLTSKMKLPTPATAMPGRPDPLPTARIHFVSGRDMHEPHPDNLEQVLFGMGSFWGAERLAWQQPGIHMTAVGYTAGITPNPTYAEVCTGLTGHSEVVRITYDPAQIPFSTLLALFWENHDPTQGMRQGKDTGTQYRSGIYTTTDGQKAAAEASRKTYQKVLSAKGLGSITTEIMKAGEFYFAEEYHQQYWAKNPDGNCKSNGVGVAYPLAEKI